MSDKLKVFLKGKVALPINLFGTTLIELLIMSGAALLLLILGRRLLGETGAYLTDFLILVWMFILNRRIQIMSIRLNENDERDLEFMDECDVRFNEIKKDS